ncbi:hypothetical protein N9878_00540 [bacterium]|nr:hypothetical protein [bacterium]
MPIFTGGPVTVENKTLDQFSVGTGEALRAYEDDALRFSPTSSISRFIEQITTENDGEEISIEEQQEHIAAAEVPLKAEPGTNRATLDLLIKRKQEELADQNTMQRASTAQAIGGFGAGFVAAAFDPINLAVGLVPLVGPTRYAGMLARQTTTSGRASLRFGTGAAEGFLGSVVVEPIVATQASNEQADYTMADTLLNITFGTVLGGGLHAGGGFVSDRVRAGQAKETAASELAKLTPEQREVMFRSNMALLVSDRNILPPSTFNQALKSSTSVGRVPETQLAPSGVKINEATVVSQEPIPANVEALAREADPQLHIQLDQLRTQQNSFRGQIDKLNSQRKDAPEVAALDQQITALQEKATTANKRNVKRIEKDIEALVKKRDAVIKEPLPEVKRLRERLIETDEKIRDIAPAIASTLRQAELKAKNAAVSFGAPQERTTFNVEPENYNGGDIVKARSTQNLRLGNAEYSAKLESELLPLDAFTKLPDAEESLKLETERLDDAINTLDAEDEHGYKAISEADQTEVNESIAMDEAYARGLRAMTMCATRKGG